MTNLSDNSDLKSEETRPLVTGLLKNTDDSQPPERRRRRSGDVITALHYQLSATRSAADLEAVVLVDDHGCLVAGAGAWPVCEELAAYAPFFGNPSQIAHKRVSARVARLATETESLTLELEGSDVVLCARGGSDERRAWLARAAAGCQRILAA